MTTGATPKDLSDVMSDLTTPPSVGAGGEKKRKASMEDEQMEFSNTTASADLNGKDGLEGPEEAETMEEGKGDATTMEDGEENIEDPVLPQKKIRQASSSTPSSPDKSAGLATRSSVTTFSSSSRHNNTTTHTSSSSSPPPTL